MKLLQRHFAIRAGGKDRVINEGEADRAARPSRYDVALVKCVAGLGWKALTVAYDEGVAPDRFDLCDPWGLSQRRRDRPKDQQKAYPDFLDQTHEVTQFRRKCRSPIQLYN